MSDRKQPFDMYDSNPDPITGEPGAHPIATGVGATSIGTLGAAVGGVVGGPIGAVVGAAAGAVAGGLFGKNAAEILNPTIEDDYWREQYPSRPYAEPDRHYEDYQLAYRVGYEGYQRHAATGKSYHEVEPELQRDYEQRRGSTGLAWDKAKHATHDAWQRLEHAASPQHHPQAAANQEYPTRVPAPAVLPDKRVVIEPEEHSRQR